MSLVTDNFNRSDESPLSGGGAWTAWGGFARPNLSSNQVRWDSVAGGEQASRYTGISWGENQTAEIEVGAALGNDDYVGVIARASGAGGSEDGLILRLHKKHPDFGGGYEIILAEFIGGGGGGSGHAVSAPSIGDKIRLELTGTAVKGYYKGNLEFDTTTTVTGGSPGLYITADANTVRADNWAGEDALITATPGAASLSLAGLPSSLDNLDPPAGALALAGAAPSSYSGTPVSPSAGALQLAGAAPSVSHLESLRDEWAVLRKYTTVLTDSWTVVPTRLVSTLRDEWTVLQELAPLRDEWRVYPDKLPDLFAEPVHEPRALATVS